MLGYSWQKHQGIFQHIKAFYKCAKYAYYSAGLIGMITGLRLYIEGKLNLPAKTDQILTEQEEKSIDFKV